MSFPALVFITEETGPSIAGLEVLDRTLVGIARAGYTPITLVGPKRPLPMRCAALGIAVQQKQSAEALISPCLVASGQSFADKVDLAALEPGERLEDLAVGVIEAWPSPEPADLPAALEGLRPRTRTRPGRWVRCEADALEAEKQVWSSLGSSADGVIDKAFNRPLGRLLTRALVKTPISPNLISLVALGIGLGAAICLAPGQHAWAIAGALLFQLSAVIDCVDGELARVLFKESTFGRWLDIGADQVVHIAIFLGSAAGMTARGSGELALWLGGAAAVGAVVSFLVVLRGLLTPEDRRHPRLQKLIDSVATRDFSLLLLVLALLDHIDWFLWMMAIGTHVFWLGALIIQMLAGSARANEQP